MRILWIDHFSRVNKCDKWLHTDFALEVKKYVDDLFIYGPNMYEMFKGDKSIVPIPFNFSLTMEYIIDKLKIDVIILNTRAAAYHPNYFPVSLFPDRNGDVGYCWLPLDFATYPIRKICIEEDFHYEASYDWHRSMGITVVLQKHFSQSLRMQTVPVEFFPFSVDTSIFTPYYGARKNKFCFVGASSPDCYPQRFVAHTMLQRSNIIDVFRSRERVFDDYIKCMHEYVSHVSCGSKYNLTSAKTFEIMACGSVLFTNKFTGIETVLDEGSYITYENDWRDLSDKANQILRDESLRKSVVDRAIHCINTRHTHEIRIKELLAFIEKYR